MRPQSPSVRNNSKAERDVGTSRRCRVEAHPVGTFVNYTTNDGTELTLLPLGASTACKASKGIGRDGVLQRPEPGRSKPALSRWDGLRHGQYL